MKFNETIFTESVPIIHEKLIPTFGEKVKFRNGGKKVLQIDTEFYLVPGEHGKNVRKYFVVIGQIFLKDLIWRKDEFRLEH